MLRHGWLMLVVGACVQSAPELQLFAPSRLVDDGRAVELMAVVEGHEGVVAVEATAGSFDHEALRLQNGSAVFRYSCSSAADARCAGRVVVTARFRSLEEKRSLEVVPAGARPGGGTGDNDAGGQAGGGFTGGGSSGGGLAAGGTPEAGGTAAGGSGGSGAAGGSAGGSVLRDAGPPPFDCPGYDGGVHPGYTFEDGGPLSVGCDGEPIDGVFLTTTSANRVSVCGRVRLAQPTTMPVFPRSIFIGSLTTSSLVGLNCCGTLRCLRNPNEVRYRFEIESGRFRLGVGARSDDYSYSQFGYYAGTEGAPLADPDAGTLLIVEGVLDGGSPIIRNVDFFVGPGKRPGDP